MIKEYLRNEIILFFLLLFFISKEHYQRNAHILYTKEYSLCKSMLGYTNYISQNSLCELPCFIKNKYTITNRTYGWCKPNNISLIRNESYIYVSNDGYIIFYNFNSNNNKSEEKIKKIYVNNYKI